MSGEDERLISKSSDEHSRHRASDRQARRDFGPRYTHVVVGGGTAGCVLARRLSDDGAAHVLLVEAGGSVQPSAVDVPAGWFGLSGSQIDWRFATTPQNHANGRALPVPRGKTLGGSSVINALVHHRGVADDYDRWETLGASGWGEAAMAPMLRRCETWLGKQDARRGVAGPVAVAPVEAPTPAALRFLDGAAQAGYGLREDLNADPGVGASLNQVAFDRRHRMSSYRAYLVPVLERPNLTIATHAQVIGLVFRSARCTGVRYLKDGEEHLAEAERDVILSAGAIQSPQILMLSGIGAAANLVRHGVKPILDLPEVGRNLHEHLIFPGVSIETWAPLPPSQLMGTDAVLYARSAQACGRRDILLNFAAFAAMAGRTPTAPAGCSISFAHMKPKSRGRIELAGADPLASPRIDPNVLADRADIDGALTAFQIARDILNGPAFADVRVREMEPGPMAASRSDLRAYLMATGVMFGHSVGTCRMGTDTDAVVDPATLKVIGTENLRVADASIMPEIPSVPTNATVLALAERASDLISNRSA